MSYLKIKIDDKFSKPLAAKLKKAGPRAACAVALQIVLDTDPFVPARTLSMANRTQISQDDEDTHLAEDAKKITKANVEAGIPKVVYPGPYARYLYYGKVMVDKETGKGPMRIVSKDGSEVIRFRKGAKLTETSKPLKISRAVHPQATDHWLEASKAQNLDKWIRAAGKAVERELRE